MTEPLRVFLVDDQSLVRSGIAMVLSVEQGIEVVGQAADARGALEALRAEPVDVVLMDIQMPGMSGLEAARHVVREELGRVIMLTTFNRPDYLLGALEAGASGFVLKSAGGEELVDAIEAVAEGHALLSPEETLPMIRRIAAQEAKGDFASGAGRGASLRSEDGAALAELSDREIEVLRLVAQGKSNTEIAEELFLGMATVKTHISRIFSKTGSRDRVQAVIFAYRTGLASAQPPNAR